MGTSVVKNLSNLSPAMRKALLIGFDPDGPRSFSRQQTIDALVTRGLALRSDVRATGKFVLTVDGKRARALIINDKPTAEEFLSGAATLDEYMPGTTRQQQHDAGNHETCLRGECDELRPDRPCGFRWVAEIEPCPRCGLSAASHDQDWPSAVTDRPAWRDELDAQVREVPPAVVRERESRSVSAHLRRARVLLTLLGAAEFVGVPDFTGADLRAYGNDVEIQLMSPEHLAPWAGLLGVNRVVVERRDTFVRVAIDSTMHGMQVRCWDHLTDYRQGRRMHSWAVAHGVTAQDWAVDSEFSLTVPEYLAALAATRQG